MNDSNIRTISRGVKSGNAWARIAHASTGRRHYSQCPSCGIWIAGGTMELAARKAERCAKKDAEITK